MRITNIIRILYSLVVLNEIGQLVEQNDQFTDNVYFLYYFEVWLGSISPGGSQQKNSVTAFQLLLSKI